MSWLRHHQRSPRKSVITTCEVLAVSCLTVFLSVSGCNRSSAPDIAPIPSLSAEDLVATPESHAHSMIKVTGCFVMGFEMVALQPCASKNPADRIWVESPAMIEEIRKHRLPEVPEATPPELRSSPSELKSSAKGMVLFEYDAGRNSKAWKKLESLWALAPPAPQVVLVGQFETIALRAPRTKGSGFGHLGAYAHELILLDGLDSKPSTTR